MSLVKLVEKLIYLLCVLTYSHTKLQKWDDTLAQIYLENGWKVAKFPYFQNRQLNTVKAFMKHGIQICIRCPYSHVFAESGQQISNDPQYPEKLTLFGPIQKIHWNTSYYIFCPNFNETKLQAFLVTNTGLGLTNPIIHQLNYIADTYKIQPDIILNFNGEHLKGITNEFPPYIINPCSRKTVECSSNEPLRGLYIDYITMLANLLNFTFSIDLNSDWGIVPTPIAKNHTWTGVLGGIINNQYDFSISNWLWTLDRDPFIDFIPVDYGNTVLALTPKRKALDFQLFIRPFTNQAWIAILITTSACFMALIIPYIFVKAYELSDAHMTAATATWLLFTLINAYYSGALTMFFSTKEQIPFSSIQDVIRAFPGYQLKMIKGNDIYFMNSQDRNIQKFAHRIEKYPEESVVSDLQSGLDQLKIDQNIVLHSSEGMLKSVFKADPFRYQELQTFAKGPYEFYGPIFPKKSPLKSIFNRVTQKMRQAGMIDQLMAKWQGTSLPKITSNENQDLGMGQIILVFIIILSGVFCAFLVNFVEILIDKLLKWKKKVKKKKTKIIMVKSVKQ